MEIEKLKEQIDIKRLICELSEIIALKNEERRVIKAYKEMRLYENALSRLRCENKEVEKQAKSGYEYEVSRLREYVNGYKERCNKFSEYYVAAELKATEQNEKFMESENFDHQTEMIISSMYEEVQKINLKISDAKSVLKKYKD